MDEAVRNRRIEGLTGLRGLAAVWVLALHAWEFGGGVRLPLTLGGITWDPTWLLSCGYFGVDLFFVLSGFLLSLPYHRAAAGQQAWPSLRDFWRHRIRRVLPAYWLQLIVLIGVFAVLGQVDRIQPLNLIGHALLVQNLLPVPQPLLNPVYWSMPVEWNFYAVLPLIALLFRSAHGGLVIVLAVVWSLTFRLLAYLSWFDPDLGRYISYPNVHQLPARIDQFGFGMLAAWILVRRPHWTRRASALLWTGVGGGLAMVVAAGPKGDFLKAFDAPWLFFHHSLIAGALALVVLGIAAGAGGVCAKPVGSLMVWLGSISYSLYLWHYPLLIAMTSLGVFTMFGMPALAGVLMIGLPLSLLMAWLSYRYVELPFLAGRH